jgi:hypothetical protein
MKKHIINGLLAISALVLFVSSAYSDPPVKVWEKVYHNSVGIQDSAVAVCVNSNGNVFVTGWTSAGSNQIDIVTIRYNSSTGDTIWVKKYSQPQEDKPYAMIADNDFVYVTGWSFTNSNRDIVTIKYNVSNGDEVWARKYNGSGNGGDYGLALDIDGSGNVYAGGRIDVGGSQKFIILKYDSGGNLPSGWPMIYSGGISGAFDEIRGIKVDGSGNVYATGFTRNGSLATDDYLTLKTNSSGSVQWAKKHNGNINMADNPVGLVLDGTENNVFVAGSSLRGGTNQDIVTIKYAASTGDSVGAAIYNGPFGGGDVAVAIIKDANDNLYITGNSFAASTGYDYVTISYNSSLSLRWAARYEGPSGSDFPSSIAYSQGFVYVTGTSAGSGTSNDYLTVRYDATNGNELWTVRENGGASRNDYGISIAVTDSQNVFVTGSMVFSGAAANYYTIRYQEVTGIKPISSIVPADYSLQQNYPNPFNPVTKIRFDIPAYTLVNITVFDAAGREITVLANEYLRAGEYEADWNAAGYSSGIYFYRLSTDKFSQTRKMILLK